MTGVRSPDPPISPQTDIEQAFQELAGQWQEETAHLSSQTQIAMHPAYQRIIGLGPVALPLIFRDLERKSNFWFWALRALTGENPVKSEDQGRVGRMTEAWLAFGRERGYL
jgi:hypothetical protein